MSPEKLSLEQAAANHKYYVSDFTKEAFIAGAKFREAQFMNIVNEIKKALNNIEHDFNHYFYCTEKYLEVNSPKQDIIKIGTPIRSAKKHLHEALVNVNKALDEMKAR